MEKQLEFNPLVNKSAVWKEVGTYCSLGIAQTSSKNGKKRQMI